MTTAEGLWPSFLTLLFKFKKSSPANIQAVMCPSLPFSDQVLFTLTMTTDVIVVIVH